MLNLFVAQFPRSVSGRINLGAAHLARVRRIAGTPEGLSVVLLPVLSDPGIALRGSADGGDLEQAQGHFERALAIRPDETLAEAGLGLVNTWRGRYEQARHHLSRARSGAKKNPDFVLCLGNVEFLAGDYAQAVRLYRESLRQRPGWPEARKNLALAHERLGELGAARQLWSGLTDDDLLGAEARRRLQVLAERG
jgi:tetratricopeptide (TPR) repeat protein